MSWVPNAIKKIEAQEFEILHQTVFGGYGTKPNVFWAVDPADMPVTLRENVEETVVDDARGMNTCAIIRLGILAAYHDEELQATGNPIACFSVYLGTNGSDVQYERQINIYADVRPVTPQDAQDTWGEIEGNAVSRRLRKMSVTMGWTEPPPMIRRESNAMPGMRGAPHRASIAMANSRGPPHRASIAVPNPRGARASISVPETTRSARAPSVAAVANSGRKMSLAPEGQYRTEAASKRFTRKLSLSRGWMESSKPKLNLQVETQAQSEAALAAALAALEGSPSTPTSPTRLQVPELVPSSPADTSSTRNGSFSSPFETVTPPKSNSLSPLAIETPVVKLDAVNAAEIAARKAKRKSTMGKRISVYEDIPEVQQADPPSVQINLADDTPEVFEENGRPNTFGSAPAALLEAPLEEEASAPEKDNDFASRRMKRQSYKRVSAFMQEDIPENGEMPMINFQDAPTQVDPAALNDALAALEGAPSPRHEEAPPAVEIAEATTRRMKRMSAKRVSLFLEDDIPEACEPEPTAEEDDGNNNNNNNAPDIPDKSPSRKASVVYALAALEQPTPPQPQVEQHHHHQHPRRQDKATKSRKTMSMYIEPGHCAGGHFMQPEHQRSYFEDDPPETEFESTSRKLKRLSWNVVGRALPQLRHQQQQQQQTDSSSSSADRKLKRSSWYHSSSPSSSAYKAAPPEAPSSHNNTVAPTTTTRPWDQPTVNAQAKRRAGPEPIARKTNRSSWYSMDPTVAEIQCSPRKELGPPAPWLEQPQPQHGTSASAGLLDEPLPVEPHGNITRTSKRMSWYPHNNQNKAGGINRLAPLADDEGEDMPPSPLRHEMRGSMSPGAPGSSVREELLAPADDPRLRKKNNRLSRFAFPQSNSSVVSSPPKKFPVESFPDLRERGPLNSNPASVMTPSRPATPLSPTTNKAPHKQSRMKRFVGKLFR